jgi:hypothetical protein
VKIRKEDLTELAFTLNWHVLRVQGYVSYFVRVYRDFLCSLRFVAFCRIVARDCA